MEMIVVTNNPQVQERYKDFLTIYYHQGAGYLDIMREVRDFVHRGASLLIHPLYGNFKPFEIPYRTIAVSLGELRNEESSVMLIEQVMDQIQVTDQQDNKKVHVQRYLEDYQLIDLSLFENALANISTYRDDLKMN